LISAATQRAADLENRYETAFEKVVADNRSRVLKLEEKHGQEREEFEDSWTRPMKTRLYSHASLSLMELRRQSIMLMRAGRYDEQRQTERMLAELEMNEIGEHSRAMAMEYDVQMKALEERQSQEMKALLVANEGRVILLQRARDKEVMAAKQRIQNLEKERDSQRESDAFLEKPKVEAVREEPRVRAAARSAPQNIAQICLLKLPPLTAASKRRPQCPSVASIGHPK
jgi:hypothetical protein